MMKRGAADEPPTSPLFVRSGGDEYDLGWTAAAARLVRIRPHVFEVHALASSGAITLSGNVVSEEVKDLIEEIFRDYDHKANLTNAIEVTAPFRSAGYDDDGFEIKAAQPREIAVFKRYPAFVPRSRPVLGKPFRFEVDLVQTVNDQPAIRVEIPEDLVTIDVQIVSAQLFFADNFDRRKVVVERDGTSIAARFEAEVVELTDDGFVDVQASFMCRGRFSGTGRQRFKADPPPADAQQAAASGGGSSDLWIFPSVGRPELTIQILKVGDTRWTWVLDAPRGFKLGTRQRNEIVDLGDTREFATRLLSECPDMEQGQHAGRLRGIGEQIWAAAPAVFRTLYKDMREKFGAAFTIQIVTAEPFIPWEMMFPDAQSGIAAPDHLFMTHPMGRWYASSGGIMPPAFERGSIASFVPEYPPKSRQALPAAIEEGEWLVTNVGAEAQNASRAGFVSFWTTDLPSRRVAVLHFAGHGDIEQTPRIKLSDGSVYCSEVNGDVKLGERDHPFVVLNACETGGGAFGLGMVSGWAANLIAREFGGLLAPQWKVEDNCASQVVRDFIASFHKGVPIGTAMLRARAAQRAASPTAFAYVCHGDVNARMC